MKVHIQNVAKGKAIMRRIPNNKIGTPQGIPDFSFSDFIPPNQKKDEGVDWVDSMSQQNKKFAEIIKNAADFKRNLNLVARNTGPNIPSGSSIPALQPWLHPNAAAIENPSNLLGIRYFMCYKCSQLEIVPFYMSADPMNRGGLSGHRCQLKESMYKFADFMEMDSKNILEFSSEVQKWTDDLPTLYALKADHPPSPMPELNRVNFGELLETDYICEAVRNMEKKKGTVLSLPQLSDFVSKVRATYCLCEFSRNGKKEIYLMFVTKPPKVPRSELVFTTAISRGMIGVQNEVKRILSGKPLRAD